MIMNSTTKPSLMSRFWALANPTRFREVTRPLIVILAIVSVLVLVIGQYMTWFLVPADYQQGESVRIMYIHVPAAWMSMLFYMIMSASALGTLVWRHPLADVSQKVAAPIGATFTLICLITGSLWGKPTWGTYWVWDARLTSVLVLFIMYLGIMAVWNTLEEPSRAARTVAILTLVGLVNIPIIKFSVDWWNTLHQPASVLKLTGSSIHPSMLYPLLVMGSGFALLGITLHFAMMHVEILKRRLRTIILIAAQKGGQ
jgi:heme exporter protein C